MESAGANHRRFDIQLQVHPIFANGLVVKFYFNVGYFVSLDRFFIGHIGRWRAIIIQCIFKKLFYAYAD
jgi:hypothetical protein